MTESRFEGEELLAGFIQSEDRREWVTEEVLFDKVRFEKRLRDLGIQAHDYKQDVDAYDRILREMDETYSAHTKFLRGYFRLKDPSRLAEMSREALEISHRSALEKLRDLIRRREYVTESTENRELRIPLFVLSPPKVKGCEVTFEHEVEEENKAQWGLTIYGSGGGATITYAVGLTTTFSSTSPVRKLVFAPITVQVNRITVIQKGKVVGRGFSIEPAFTSSAQLGLEVMKGRKYTSPDRSAPVKRYPLGRDTTGDLADYSTKFTSAKTYETAIGLEIGKMKSSVKTTVELKQTITIGLKLAGGYDYVLLPLRDIPGHHWSLED